MLGRLIGHAPADEERFTFRPADYLAAFAGSASYSPVPVTVQRALTHAASSACIDVLASSVSATPVDVIRMQGRARVPVVPTPMIVEAPSPLVEQDAWQYQLADSMLTDGNGFGMVTGVDAMARPTGIELLDPTRVGERRVVDGVPRVSVDGSKHQLYPFGDVWHVPGKFVRAGSPFAESPITRAAATIGAAIAARDFGARFFDAGGQPVSGFWTEQDITPQQADETKRAFMRATQNREPFVRGSGWQYEQYSVDPNDSQFIDLMRFAIEEACRFWRVPPAMVYAATSGQNVTYANVSQADLHYLKHSLEWLFVRLERAWSKLIARPQVVRFNRNAFLRADAPTRGDYMDKRLRNKSMSINEYRALEDEPPVDDPEFDQPGIPGGAVDAGNPPAAGGT